MMRDVAKERHISRKTKMVMAKKHVKEQKNGENNVDINGIKYHLASK